MLAFGYINEVGFWTTDVSIKNELQFKRLFIINNQGIEDKGEGENDKFRLRNNP